MSRTMSRRQFVRAGAGLAAAAYFGGVSTAFGRGSAGGHPTVQPHLLGVQHFSVRDATARLSIAASTRLGVTPTMGRLGGPGYPEDPTDLGPLVPVPGGYAEVFEYLACGGDRVVVLITSTLRATETDQSVPQRMVEVITVEDGKITDFTPYYFDTVPVVKTFQ